MRQNKVLVELLSALLVVAAGAALFTYLPAPSGQETLGGCAEGAPIRVIRAVDGDTLVATPLGRGAEPAAFRWAPRRIPDSRGPRWAPRRIPDSRGPRWRVRLLAINAPEKSEPLGPAASAALRGLAEGKAACLFLGREPADRYGRLVADVRVGGRSLSLLMVRRGLARIFRRYLGNAPISLQADLLMAQERAKREGLGIWSAPGGGPSGGPKGKKP